MGQVAPNTARWFEDYVRRSLMKGWSHDTGEWLVSYGASLLGRDTAQIIFDRVQRELS
jgi:hypothetical protein